MKKNDVLNFFTQVKHWEYWPLELVYFPIVIYWLWLSAKARSFFYFMSANPSMETGGLVGECKWNTLKQLPAKFKPQTLFIKNGTAVAEIKNLTARYQISYPLIAKPNIGERGRFVEKISDDAHLEKYIKSIRQDFLIQEFVDYPIELGIFYYRHPHAKKGKIPSVVMKDMLKVKGDGNSTVEELMSKYPRARFQLKRFQTDHKSLMKYVPGLSELMELEPIGNHCRGTTFLDANDLIDEQLETVFDEISKHLPNFYYGRYDIKCMSIEALKRGESIKVMELNGAGAEPSHIYNPGFSIFKAYKVLFKHWKIMFEISEENKRAGFAYPGTVEGYKKFREAISFANLRKA